MPGFFSSLFVSFHYLLFIFFCVIFLSLDRKIPVHLFDRFETST